MALAASTFVQHLRSGDWLTAARLRGYSLILLALCAAALVGWLALSDGLIDRNGKPIGTDFSNVYAAGTLVRQGRAADAYDPALQHQAEKVVFGGRDVPLFGWHYPPFFLFIAAALATLPYLWALLAWQALGLTAFLAMARTLVPRRQTLLVAAAFPAGFVNIGHGQNGFLTAALLGGALHLLPTRPALAGLLIGGLAYKPQFGVLIPLALLAGGHWRALVAAAATVIALSALSTAAFGLDIWHAFAASTAFSREVILEHGATGWEKIQSIFSAVRMWGGDTDAAYAAQAALALTLAAALVWLWRSEAAYDLKAAALATACLLATPYVLDYDLVALGVALAFVVRHGLAHGFRDWEITVLAAAWFTPLIGRGVMAGTGVPLGLLALLAVGTMIACRVAHDIVNPRAIWPQPAKS